MYYAIELYYAIVLKMDKKAQFMYSNLELTRFFLNGEVKKKGKND